MAKDTFQAMDAGQKRMDVTISADGTTVSIATPFEVISIVQSHLEKLLANSKEDVSDAEFLLETDKKTKEVEGSHVNFSRSKKEKSDVE